MAKVTKTSSNPFVKGGNGKMFGKQSTGTQTPGQTATKAKSTGGKFPMGGKGKMVGKQSAGPAKAC